MFPLHLFSCPQQAGTVDQNPVLQLSDVTSYLESLPGLKPQDLGHISTGHDRELCSNR